MKLYQIANEYQQAFDAMQDMDLSYEVIADSLGCIQAEFEDKAKAVAAHIQNLEAEAKEIKEAAKRMQERHSKLLNKVDSIKNYLLTNMLACDALKISTPEFCASIRKNPPKLILEDDKLPADYIEERIITEKVIMKDTIKNALKEGMEIPGARLEQGFRLHFQ